MVTLTANEQLDNEKIRETWQLPSWAKVQVHFRREGKDKEIIEWDCVAVFDYMDWMYWLWHDEKTNEPLIFNWYFRQVDQDCFVLLTKEEVDKLWLN